MTPSVKPCRALIVAADHEGSHGRYMAGGLAALGVETGFFDYRKLAYGAAYDQPRSAWRRRLRGLARRVLAPNAEAKMRAGLLHRVAEEAPDLIVVSKGEILPGGFLQDLRAAALERRPDTKLVTWHTDPPAWVRYATPLMVDAIPAYDLVAVFDKHYVPELQRLGAKRALYLPLAYAPDLHRAIEACEEDRRRYASPVCFVGDWKGARREAWLRPLARLGLAIWGRGWERAAEPLRSCWRGRPARGDELCRIYATAGAVANVHEAHSITAPNMRVFEVSACGAPLVTDGVPELPGFLEPEAEVLVAGSPEDMARLVQRCLADPAWARAMGRRAKSRVEGRHSYAARMEVLLRELRLAPCLPLVERRSA